MRKISVLLAVFIIAAVGLNAQEMTILKVKILVANIRTDPDMNSAVLKQVKLGTLLESRQKIGDWYEVMVTDDKGEAKSGFITANVVDVVSAGGAEAAAQTGPPPAAEGQSRWPSIMIFGRYGSFSPSDKIFKTVYGGGSVYGGEFRIHVEGGFFVCLEAGYFQKTGALTVTQEETTMTIYPIEAMVVFHALSGVVLPYVGAGGAVCKYSEENVIGKVDKWGFGFAVCGGVTARWRFLGLDARVKYTSVNIKPFEVKAALGGLTLSIAAGVVF